MEKKEYSFKLLQIRVILKCMSLFFRLIWTKRERQRGYLTSSVNKCQDEKKHLRIFSPSLPYLTCDPSSQQEPVQRRNSVQPPSCPHWHILAEKPHCATVTCLSNTRSVLNHHNWAWAIPTGISQPSQLAPGCPSKPSSGVTPGVSACAGSGCSPSEGASGSLWGLGFSCLQVVLHEPVGSLPPWPAKTMDSVCHGQKKRHQNLIYFGDVREKSGLREARYG